MCKDDVHRIVKWEREKTLKKKFEGFLRDRFEPDCKVDTISGIELGYDCKLTDRETRESCVFILYTRPRLYPSQLPQLVEQIRRHEENDKNNIISIIGAPRLSKESRQYLKSQGIPYLDLDGGLYFQRELFNTKYDVDYDNYGSPYLNVNEKQDSYKFPGVSRGRAAIYRILLVDQGRCWGIRELARVAGMDPGSTSRYIKELVEEKWVARRSRSEFILKEPSILLDYWSEMSRRLKRYARTYLLPAESYDELRRKIAAYMADEPNAYHTRWSGAEFYGHFQDQPIIALYCPDPATAQEKLRARETSPNQSANLWLRFLPDKAIGHGASEKDGERVVCWQQVYVDLMNAPHRGKSIAVMLREEMETKSV